MKDNWLWDRKITDAEARKILKKPMVGNFLNLAALLLSRRNEPRDIFKNYLDPLVFCKYWTMIKRKMRQDKWANPRIIFWQAIYEKLLDKYRKNGIVFRKEMPTKNAICAETGKNMGGIRRERGLSQKELAKKIGISQQLISRIEKGRENVSLTTLTNIAVALGKKIKVEFY